MSLEENNQIRSVLNHLTKEGTCGFGEVMKSFFNIAMRLEREEYLGAVHYQRTDDRWAYANGYKSKKLHCELGSLTLSIPKTAGHGDSPFYPNSLERGRLHIKAFELAIRSMYTNGVTTNKVKTVLSKFGLQNLPSATVLRVSSEIKEQLESWRSSPLSKCPYLVLDVRFEKVRVSGADRRVAILTAIGINENGTRSVLGVEVSHSEAEIYWKDFLSSLVERGLTGVEYIVSDDHNGLKAAKRAVFSRAKWHHYQFRPSEKAIARAPKKKPRKSIGKK